MTHVPAPGWLVTTSQPTDRRHPIGHVLQTAALGDLTPIEARAVVVDLEDDLVVLLGQA